MISGGTKSMNLAPVSILLLSRYWATPLRWGFPFEDIGHCRVKSDRSDTNYAHGRRWCVYLCRSSYGLHAAVGEIRKPAAIFSYDVRVVSNL